MSAGTPERSNDPVPPEPEALSRRNDIFAAPPDDPRARRPADVFELVIAVAILVFAGWAYRADTDLDLRVLEFFSGGLPGWLSATLTIGFVLGGLYSAGLIIGIAVLARDRRKLLRDMLLAHPG